MSTTLTTTTTLTGDTIHVGQSVPPLTDHAISVSLPTWKDVVGYEEGDKRVSDAMVNGYPRFFIHFSIQKLSRICLQKFGITGESCLLLPTKKIAEHCRSFILSRSSRSSPPVRLIEYLICPEDKPGARSNSAPSRCGELHIVLFPEDTFSIAKQFWQHTGLGICSRFADYCLSMLPDEPSSPIAPSSPGLARPSKGGNRHYSNKSLSNGTGTNKSPVIPTQVPSAVAAAEALTKDHSVYLEERYGRNLSLSSASSAKRVLRRRIAGVLIKDTATPDLPIQEEEMEIGPSTRGVSTLSEDDVYLYPTGMSAIWSAHHLARMTRPDAKSICFGFPYADTLKVLEKWGAGCHFFGHGLDSDIDLLESLLPQEGILALFTEFPSNPLLRSADLPRLRNLADKYDFLIVVDDTLGNFVNVDVLQWADVVVSSLSKIFSGDANVMGGSLVLNPAGRHYQSLKLYMSANHEDVYFDEDAIYMERNSRDFERRIRIIDDNTEAMCDYLRVHSLSGGAGEGSVIKEVFYPKWTTRDRFEQCRIIQPSSPSPQGGFGGLFSLTFISLPASEAFFDTLSCYKGPSLGTNFTLACPFTVLAHYAEMEWTEQFGVERGLVRISVGMEERGSLIRCLEAALKAAEEAEKANDL